RCRRRLATDVRAHAADVVLAERALDRRQVRQLLTGSRDAARGDATDAVVVEAGVGVALALDEARGAHARAGRVVEPRRAARRRLPVLVRGGLVVVDACPVAFVGHGGVSWQAGPGEQG